MVKITFSDPEQEALMREGNAIGGRQDRDRLLLETDWTQMADNGLTAAKKAEYAAYRQALRDITTHEDWPFLDPEEWPVKPT